MMTEGTWEAAAYDRLPQLQHMQAAVVEMLQATDPAAAAAAAAAAVQLHSYMGLPRQGHFPLVDTIYPDKAVFEGQRNRLGLDHIAYQRTWE
jgi:hypothetical protein